MVKEGELLVELDQAQFKGAVDRGEAGLAQANAGQVQATANRDQAKRALDRQTELKRTSPNLITDESGGTGAPGVPGGGRQPQVGRRRWWTRPRPASRKPRTTSPGPCSTRRSAGASCGSRWRRAKSPCPGTFSKETGLLMRIADLSTILAKVKVDETDVVRLAMNDSVSVVDRRLPRHDVRRAGHQDRQQRDSGDHHRHERRQGGGLRRRSDVDQSAQGRAAGPQHDVAHHHGGAEEHAQHSDHRAHRARCAEPGQRRHDRPRRSPPRRAIR